MWTARSRNALRCALTGVAAWCMSAAGCVEGGCGAQRAVVERAATLDPVGEAERAYQEQIEKRTQHIEGATERSLGGGEEEGRGEIKSGEWRGASDEAWKKAGKGSWSGPGVDKR